MRAGARISALFKAEKGGVGWWAGGQRVANFVHKSAQAVYIYYTLRRMQCNFRPSTRICNVAHGTGDTLALACHAIDPQWFVAKIWQMIIV